MINHTIAIFCYEHSLLIFHIPFCVCVCVCVCVCFIFSYRCRILTQQHSILYVSMTTNFLKVPYKIGFARQLLPCIAHALFWTLYVCLCVCMCDLLGLFIVCWLGGEQVNIIELMVTEGLVDIRVGGKQSEWVININHTLGSLHLII